MRVFPGTIRRKSSFIYARSSRTSFDNLANDKSEHSKQRSKIEPTRKKSTFFTRLTHYKPGCEIEYYLSFVHVMERLLFFLGNNQGLGVITGNVLRSMAESTSRSLAATQHCLWK